VPVAAVQPRQLLVDTPLGRDVFTLVGFSGREAISQLFRFQLDLVGPNEPVPFEEIVGQPVTVTIQLPSGTGRHFHGIVSRFSQGRRDATTTLYDAEVVPWLWLLTRRTASRSFQHLSVPDIVRELLAGTPVQSSFELQAEYPARDYCVQYRETDFDFVSRLMEEEGIQYFFRHDEDKHTLVLSDRSPAAPSVGTFAFDRSAAAPDRVFEWEKTQELRSGKVTLRDHEFELPEAPIEATATIPDTVRAGQVTHRLSLEGTERLELYDYPGEWAERFDGVGAGGEDRRDDLLGIFGAARQTAEIRMEEEAEQALAIVGASTCRALESGRTFTLQGHFDADGQYLLTSVQHAASQAAQNTGTRGFEYTNSFTCIPASVFYRPPRVTPRPVLPGTQTALVVGPAGETIFTDKYGRVKVQFFWDREGKHDEQSSCWIRVAQPVGGAGQGFFWIPEVGDEVVVAFEEGDPDRPLIVGRVYNASDRPPRPE
jgi:type VI secretion system secreted protein VgrG